MEETFQKALDANPLDQTLRLVFADWLDEQGDPRAVGYRAMVKLGVHCFFYRERTSRNWVVWNALAYETKPSYKEITHLPGNWFVLIEKQADAPHNSCVNNFAWFSSRQQSEDAVALAFSKLSPAEQEQILNEAYSSTS